MTSRLLLLGLLLGLLPGAQAAEGGLKVRTITAFVPLQPAKAEATFEQAAEFLRQAQARLQAAGLEVQTLRIATPPVANYMNRMLLAERLDRLLRWDRWAQEAGVILSLGPVVLSDHYDPATVRFAVELLRRSRTLHTTVVIADEDGIQPQAVRAAAEIVHALGKIPAADPPAFRFAALAACPPGIPFFPAAYAGGQQRTFAFGLESAGVVADAVRAPAELATKRIRFKAALEGPLQRLESLGLALASDTGWVYAGIDPSPAPMGAVSIGRALENLSGTALGSAGTLATVATLTTWIRELPVRQAGFRGLMLPVLEDEVLAQRAAEGRLSLGLLLAYSAVSGTGLDVVPVPGDTEVETLERVLSDVAALAVKLRKPLTARLLLVPGKRVGEMTEFDSPFLTNTRVLPVE